MEVDLGILFSDVFGKRIPSSQPDIPTITGNSINDLNRKEFGKIGGAPFYSTGSDGIEYFLPVVISYPDNNNTTQTLELPNCILSIKSRKTIIETPLTERRGTVKEFINIQDYDIGVEGFLIEPTNELPEDGLATLRMLYEKGVPVNISCALTDIFLLRPDRSGSDAVVIYDFEIPKMKGVKNVRPYSFSMKSDEPFSLYEI